MKTLFISDIDIMNADNKYVNDPYLVILKEHGFPILGSFLLFADFINYNWYCERSPHERGVYYFVKEVTKKEEK